MVFCSIYTGGVWSRSVGGTNWFWRNPDWSLSVVVDYAIENLLQSPGNLNKFNVTQWCTLDFYKVTKGSNDLLRLT